MATATKKKDRIFTKSEMADRAKDLIKERLGLLPDGVTEEGYFYEGKKTIDRIREMRKKGNQPLIPKFFQFFELSLILFWDDIDEITDFLETIYLMTNKEFKAKYEYSNTIKFKTKNHSYTIEFTTSSDIVNFRSISRK